MPTAETRKLAHFRSSSAQDRFEAAYERALAARPATTSHSDVETQFGIDDGHHRLTGHARSVVGTEQARCPEQLPAHAGQPRVKVGLDREGVPPVRYTDHVDELTAVRRAGAGHPLIPPSPLRVLESRA